VNLVRGEYAEVPITAGNPFFDADGLPLITLPPQSLLDQMAEAGCTYAWARQQHGTSELDEVCEGLAVPFITSDPGATLGLVSGILTSGLIEYVTGFYGEAADQDDAFFTSETLMQQGAEGGMVLILSSVGWSRPGPAMLQPLANYSLDELETIMSRGGHTMPYVFHGAGEWSMKAQGALDMEEEDMILRAQYGTELWLYLGHHAQRKDPLAGLNLAPPEDPAIGRIVSSFLRHGVHAVLWSTIKTLMDRPGNRFAQPSEELWTLADELCGPAAALDYSHMAFCAHGVGHTLSWYVTKDRSSIGGPRAIARGTGRSTTV